MGEEGRRRHRTYAQESYRRLTEGAGAGGRKLKLAMGHIIRTLLTFREKQRSLCVCDIKVGWVGKGVCTGVCVCVSER